ncbi:MAG: hypothetical protein WC656_01880 [Sulfurimonas sp.]|jgi:hypothetical protein
MKKNLFIKIVLILMVGLVATASAAVTEPGSFKNYLDVFFAMVKGTGGNLAMALIMMFAGYKAYQNATPTPLLWGALAVVLIAAAPYIAVNMTANVETMIAL